MILVYLPGHSAEARITEECALICNLGSTANVLACISTMHTIEMSY
jgi:hypothetical protein